MKEIRWNEEKNRWLKEVRNVCFEEVAIIVEGNMTIDIVDNAKKYPGQRIYVVEIREYIHMVPFVENDEYVFLKTIIPNRKATKEYLKRKDNK